MEDQRLLIRLRVGLTRLNQPVGSDGDLGMQVINVWARMVSQMPLWGHARLVTAKLNSFASGLSSLAITS